jgi:crossover junction endodeoxyribonuclease RuvC
VIVLGVDPGTAATGYGVVERPDDGGPLRLIECGVIRPPARGDLARRLAVIHEEIASLLERHRPGALAVENVFVAQNVRSALVLGHARGVILLAGEEAGIPIAEYAPRQVKAAVVGAGGATKPQVGLMVAKLLRLKHAPEPADAADGVAIALTHCLTGLRRFRRAKVG